MHSLEMILIRIVMGQVDVASRRLTHRPRWRIPIYLIIAGAAAWVAVASAWLWTAASHPGVVGLIAFVGQGGPIWLLSIPAVAALTLLVASIPAAGRYGLVFILQCATFALTLAGLAVFQGDGRAAVNWPAVSSFLVTLPATLVSIVTALADTPPVESPFAYFTLTYIGRVGHLRALLASARRLGLEVSGPSGADHALTAGGYYGDRRSVQMVSGWSTPQASAADAGYWYKVTVTSPSPLPSFQIARRVIPRAVVARAVTGTVAGGLMPLRFYVIPPYGKPISESWTARFSQQIAEGKRFLRSRRDMVQLTPGGLLYSHFSTLRLTAGSGQIEPQVEWLIGVARLLEEIAPSAESVAPPGPPDFAARQPYGQISPVDPTRRPDAG